MKYCRFEVDGSEFFGEVEERDGELWATRLIRRPLDRGEDSTALESFRPRRLGDLALLPPVVASKIVCVGRNYKDHAKELGNDVPTEPLLFFKPLSSLLSPGGAIELPKASSRVDFEGEFAVIVGKRARNLSRQDDLSDYIHGYTLANDVTARDLQKKDGQTTQWTRAKGFDTFCPVGPIVNSAEGLLASLRKGLSLETRVNGELRQQGSTADFIFDLPFLLQFITSFMTLEPGDLILTGTPAGVGPLSPGDTVQVSTPELGKLVNSVRAEV